MQWLLACCNDEVFLDFLRHEEQECKTSAVLWWDLSVEIKPGCPCCAVQKLGAKLATVLQRQQEADTKKTMTYQHSLLCST